MVTRQVALDAPLPRVGALREESRNAPADLVPTDAGRIALFNG